MVSVDRLELNRLSIGEENEAFDEFRRNSLEDEEEQEEAEPEEAVGSSPQTPKRVITEIENGALREAIEAGDLETVKNIPTDQLTCCDRNGDTALHLTVFNNKPSITAYLLAQSAEINAQNSRGWTSLHSATSLALPELVEMLCYYRADVNIQDEEGNTPLHLALQLSDPAIAFVLINYYAKIDLVNKKNCLPIHFACQYGHARLVKILCSMGSPVDVASLNSDNTPLHLATMKNDVETVRCLLLCGANPDKVNSEYRKPEHLTENDDILNLFANLQQITKVSPQTYRQDLQKQLTISENPLSRLKIVVVGNTGVGKTMTIESLKCGFLKSVLLSGYYTFRSTTKQQDPSKLKLTSKVSSKNVVSKGIHLTKTTITDIGEVLITECPGYRGYFSSYSLFIGDSSSVYIIVVSLKDSEKKRCDDISFWLAFIKSRLAFSEPIGLNGCNLWSANVVIVATSATSKTVVGDPWLQNGYKSHLDNWTRIFQCNLKIYGHIFLIDAQQPKSAEVKRLRATLSELKANLTRQLPTQIACYDLVVSELKALANQMTSMPVLTMKEFSEFFHKKINILATDDAVREILTQLQIVGEIMCLGSHPDELIIISPNWLGCEMIGRLFSREAMSRAASRGHGIISHYDLRGILSTNLTSSDLARATKVMLAANICAENLHHKLGELYISTYNTMDLGDSSPWAAQEEDPAVQRGAVRLLTEYETLSTQLRIAFPHAIHALKKFFNKADVVEGFCQWNEVCRVVASNGVSGTVRWVSATSDKWVSEDELDTGAGCIEVEARTVRGDAQDVFLMCEQICAIVHASVCRQCPGLWLQRRPLCFLDVCQGVASAQRRCYSNAKMMRAMLEGTSVSSVSITNNDAFMPVLSKGSNQPETFDERLVDIFAFGSEEILEKITFGVDLSLAYLSPSCRSNLSRLVDSNPTLTSALIQGFGLDPLILSNPPPTSIFEFLLASWLQTAEEWDKTKIRQLVDIFERFGSKEMVDILLNLMPMFIFFGSEEDFKFNSKKVLSTNL